MKHSAFTLGAMLAATFALSSCNESLSPVQPTEGVPFEISTLLTKTANDGLSTVWASGDAINLFHAEAGSTTYISDGQFTVDDALTGVFSGTLASALEEGKSYDWYANYPYSSYQKTPAGISQSTGAYITVGGTSQTHAGNDSKAHLAGSACPLYGVAKNVASNVKPAIEMKQLASVVAIKVTNTLEDALTVSSVSFTSSEDIVGQYYIDYSGDAPAYKLRGDSYVSKTATLTVTDGTAIEQNSSAVFYIALKPHTAASGSTLKISVNGVEKTLTLAKDVTFTAGSIKTLEYKYDYVPATGKTTVSKTMSEMVNTNKYTLSEGSTINTIKTSLQIDDVITISSTAGGNTGSFWKNSDNEIDWRCYQNGSTTSVVKVAAAEGYTIESLSLTFKVADSGTLKTGSSQIISGTKYDINAQDVSYTIGCSKDKKSNGKIKIYAISVTYVKD